MAGTLGIRPYCCDVCASRGEEACFYTANELELHMQDHIKESVEKGDERKEDLILTTVPDPLRPDDIFIDTYDGWPVFYSPEDGSYYIYDGRMYQPDWFTLDAAKDYIDRILEPKPGFEEIRTEDPPDPDTATEAEQRDFQSKLWQRHGDYGDLAPRIGIATKLTQHMENLLADLGLTPEALDSLRGSEMDRDKVAMFASSTSTALRTGLGLLYSVGVFAEAASLGQIDTVVEAIDMFLDNAGFADLFKGLFAAPFWAGLIQPTRQYWAKHFATEIPPAPDMIRMLVREAITPDTFNQFMGYHGFNEDWTKAYWDAHWRELDKRMVDEAFHRGEISEEVWGKYHVILDYRPDVRPGMDKPDLEVARALRKTLIPRVDVRRGFDLGKISYSEMIKKYEDLGYEEDSELMADIQRDVAIDAERNAVARVAGRMYRDGIRTENWFREELRQLYILGEKQDLWVKRYLYESISKTGEGETTLPPPVEPVPEVPTVPVIQPEEVQLVGMGALPAWSIDDDRLDATVHVQSRMFEVLAESGANWVILNLDLLIYERYPDRYLAQIDEFVNLLESLGLYYTFKLHSARYSTEERFSGPGDNYKIVLDEGHRAQAINMFVNLAGRYKKRPHFIGLELLNQPYANRDFNVWDSVRDFYEDVIITCQAIAPHIYFWVQEPYGWGTTVINFKERGYLPYENVIYAYHLYTDTHHRPPWFDAYVNQGPVIGHEAYKTWFQQNYQPLLDDGKEIALTEFGIGALEEGESHWDGKLVPWPYIREEMENRLSYLNARGVHWSWWRAYDDRAAGGVPRAEYDSFTNDGTELNKKGQIWRSHIPSGLRA